MLPTYRQGRIVWASLRSQGGKKEEHPAVIITADRDIVQPERFDPRQDVSRVNAVAVMGISTKYLKYPPYVRLPFSRNMGGHPTTKLSEDSAACIGWYDWVILEDDVIGRGGDVPSDELDQLLAAAAKDLQNKLKIRVALMGRELSLLHELLAKLIGEA